MTKKRVPKNQFLPGLEKLRVREFGGTNLKGNPREARPISIKKPMHLTMRSKLAKGSKSFLLPQRAKQVQSIINKAAKDHGVRVFRYANAGNHLHLAILPRSKKAYWGFIRSISGLVARKTLGRERGPAKSLPKSARKIRFWEARPYTKILEWGRELTYVKNYIAQNALEALGFIDYQDRGIRQRKYQVPSSA